MKSFKELITELRSHPELNPHKSLVDNLEPYLYDPDIFITYTQDLGSKKGGAGVKVGINPQSKYNTPLGVYTYPLRDAWVKYGKDKQKGDNEGKLSVPFANEQPNVVVIRRKGKHINDIGIDYNSSDWDRDIAKLKDYFVNKWSKKVKVNNETDTDIDVDVKHLILLSLNIIIKDAANSAIGNSIGGKFWNVTRELSRIDHHTSSRNTIDIFYHPDTVKSRRIPGGERGRITPVNGYYEVQNTFAGISFNIDPEKIKSRYNKNDNTILDGTFNYIYPNKNDNVKSITLWNQIFRMLGYESIADRAGRGIIHEAEPIQAVFFSSRGYDVVDAFDNVGKKNVIQFNNGDKFEGVWNKGTWKDGTFEGGTWENGRWFGGTWKAGTWKAGTWENGIWETGEWKNGVWRNGTWESGTWENGSWRKGVWENGTWEDGGWRKGVWKNGTWEDGYWEDGEWKNGHWVGGTWENGVWKNGEWKSGTWRNGTWENGTWMKGTWEGGTWEGGYDKDDNFHPAGDSPDKW